MTRQIILIAFWIATYTALFGQVSVEKTDTIPTAENNYDQMVKELVQYKTPISTLWKVNAVDWGLLHPSLVVEHVLFKNFSVEPSIVLRTFDWNMSRGFNTTIQSQVTLKYYHNTARREALGREIKGFSGNHFFAGVGLTTSDNADYYEYLLKNAKQYRNPLTQKNWQIWQLYAGYGIQRRIKDVGYIEFLSGMRLAAYDEAKDHTTLSPFIKINIGFGLSGKQLKQYINK